MPRTSTLSDEQLNQLREVAHTRKSTPSNKQLAFEMCVSERTIEFYITRFMREDAVSRGTFDAKIAS